MMLVPVATAGFVMLFLSGCNGVQSSLSPSGEEAERVVVLFWVMTLAGAAIFLSVMALLAVSIAFPQRVKGWLISESFIKTAGIFFPVVVLTALLTYGLLVLGAGQSASGIDGSLRIAVEGEQWWWRVTYYDDEGNEIRSANELHIPTDEPVALELTTADVLHSFWAPQLAGKLDMIPGRKNVLTVHATKEGVSRGQCAEYCGGAHALMSFYVVAQSREDFDAWLAKEAKPAAEPATDATIAGRDLFMESGCGACHAIRGTDARGQSGPDLTHVGRRHSLAAAALPNDAKAFARWIAENQHIKPENDMPPYRIFTDRQLSLLGQYLESLQ